MTALGIGALIVFFMLSSAIILMHGAILKNRKLIHENMIEIQRLWGDLEMAEKRIYWLAGLIGRQEGRIDELEDDLNLSLYSIVEE